MAKQMKAKKVSQESFLNSFDLNKIIPAKFQVPLAISIIVLLFFIFFAPVFFHGMIFKSGDIITGKAFQTIKDTYTDGILWNPYLFAGMPAHFSGVGYLRDFDIINQSYASLRTLFGQLFSNSYTQHILYLIVLGITSFFFMRDRKATLLVSLFTAIATAFSTGIIVFIFIGHITKLDTLSMFPLVFMLLLRLKEKIKILDIILLTISMSFLVWGWHIQMIYYAFMSIGLYFSFYGIHYLVKKEKEKFSGLLKSLGIFVAATLLALGTMTDVYAQLYEYSPFSTRGAKSVVEMQDKSPTKAESDFYEYATNWSFSPGEILTFIVPSYYGFGNVKYSGPLTNNQEVEVNTYFGQMPFVDVAMYMGVIVFFLGLFSVITLRKDPLVQFLSLLCLFSLLVSFGRNFPLVYDLLYHYLPFFNKFRVPSMILTTIQVMLPILAGHGIMKIISMKENRDEFTIKVIKYFAFGATGILVIVILLNQTFVSWFEARLMASQRGQQLQQISDFMSSMFLGDLIIAFALTASTFWLAFLYVNNKISKDILAFVLIVFVVFDLFRVSTRAANFTATEDVSAMFEEPSHIRVMREQNDKDPFRMINLKQDGSLGSVSHNSNFNMFFLKQDLSGFSGIKPRTYQDYMDVVGPGNSTLWRMLNVRYVILDQAVQFPGFIPLLNEEKNHVYLNTSALPRAYFVNSIEVKKPIDILNAVKDNLFDPKEVAFVEVSLSVDKPDTTAYVIITDYTPNKITIEANASGNNFMFLGDTYYPNGWTATIDGKELKIYQANHGFRGVIVPKGKHTIEFVYEPKSYVVGKAVSLSINILLLIGLAIGLFFHFREKKNSDKVKNES